MTNYEQCSECGENTGRAGKSEDSLYAYWLGEEIGPLCECCYEGILDRQQEYYNDVDYNRYDENFIDGGC
jgi:hypothetical protein